MRVNVATLGGAEVAALVLNRTTTVGQVVQCTVGADRRMAGVVGCSSFRQRLLRGDAMLRASSSVADVGVEDGAQLTLVLEAVDRVLTSSTDGTAKVWSAKTGECMQTLSGLDSSHIPVFSSDGSSVLTAFQDHIARICSAQAGECLQTFRGHTDFVYTAVISPDGSSVLTASDDETAKVWNAKTGECTRTLSGHKGY